ncbi:MAG TPA: hypothetical protein VGN22_10585, partial [Pseudonocardia sp.]
VARVRALARRSTPATPPVLAAAGLTAQDVSRRVTEWAAALPGVQVVDEPAPSARGEQAR